MSWREAEVEAGRDRSGSCCLPRSGVVSEHDLANPRVARGASDLQPGAALHSRASSVFDLASAGVRQRGSCSLFRGRRCRSSGGCQVCRAELTRTAVSAEIDFADQDVDDDERGWRHEPQPDVTHDRAPGWLKFDDAPSRGQTAPSIRANCLPSWSMTSVSTLTRARAEDRLRPASRLTDLLCDDADSDVPSHAADRIGRSAQFRLPLGIVRFQQPR